VDFTDPTEQSTVKDASLRKCGVSISMKIHSEGRPQLSSSPDSVVSSDFGLDLTALLS
jgi:hypothetical protein